MKPLTITILLLAATVCKGQAYISLAGGYSSKSAVVVPAVGVNIKGFIIQGEVKAITADDQPVLFGFHLGYQYKFVEAGCASYSMIYSTDKYDSYKNKWVNGVYIRGYIKNIFLEYQHSKKHFITVGIKTKI